MGGGHWRFGAVAGLGLMAAACASAPPPPSLPPDPAAACLAGLDQRHITYKRLTDWTTENGCGITGAVQVDRSAIAWNRAAPMTCGLAAKIWDFEHDVAQPAALRILGHSVSLLSHAGTYSCRPVRGGHAGRLSLHATGQAIDIIGFELDDGTKISVAKNWRDKGPKGEYLKEVAKGACSLFSVVLTPNTNSLHHDHLHFDIGPYKVCSL